MNVRNNTLANAAGQSYNILIGFIITPFYLHYLGAESFGLIGFYTLIQSWMHLLDVGLSPTLGRRIAIEKARNLGFNAFFDLLRSVEFIFIIFGMIIIFFITSTNQWISEKWIKGESLNNELIVYCILLMGIIIGVRLLAGLYKGCIIGLQDQVWLNIFTIFILSLKYIGSIVVLEFWQPTVDTFFEYQLIIAILELIILQKFLYKNIQLEKNILMDLRFKSKVIKQVIPMSLGLAYTSALWILVSQSDKIILSTVLPLSEFGYFSLIALITTSIMVSTLPIWQAITPKLTELHQQGQFHSFEKLYRQASKFAVSISCSITCVVCMYPEFVIYSWTGDMNAASWGYQVLFWYSLGTFFLAASSAQYFLQISIGSVRLHVIGSTATVFLQLPVIYWAAINYSALGAGLSWFLCRILLFIFWVPYVHRRFLPGLQFKWLLLDTFPIVIVTFFAAASVREIIILTFEADRIMLLGQIFLISTLILLLSLFSIKEFRDSIRKFIFIKKTKYYWQDK
jgi:O-antigen/teichoic acid export membrane protein